MKSAYSSQECARCHYTDRANRPRQETFSCRVCGQQTNADANAAANIAARLGDRTLAACTDRAAVKALLAARHQAYLLEAAASGSP